MIRSRLAFTLLELIVVIAIASVLAVTAAPRLSAHVQAAAVRAAGAETVACARWARAEAVRLGTSVQLCRHDGSLALRIGSGSPRVVRRLPDTVRLEGADALLFRPDGTAQAGTWTVRGADGRFLLVHIDPATGLSRLETP